MLGPHLGAPEQLVDVPVPQVPERSTSRLLHEVLRWRQQAEEGSQVA